MKKGFHNEPLNNKNYLETKIKYHDGKLSTNFHGNEISRKGSHCICLSVLLTDSIIGKNCYPELFLGECKYHVKERKMTKYVTNAIETSFDESDEKVLMMKILTKKTLMKKRKF